MPSAVQNEVAPPFARDGVFVAKSVVDEVLPNDVQMLRPDHLQLTMQSIEKPLHGVAQKWHHVTSRLACRIELAGVVESCRVIMGAQ